MRNLSPGLQAHLNQSTTSLCKCWRLTTRSGEVFGFTDHDQALFFDDILHKAKSGGALAGQSASAGVSTDNSQFDAILNDDDLREIDLLNGKFDQAAFEVWLVNWQDLSQRALLNTGYIGEIQHTPNGFIAEFRGVKHQLNRQIGRLYQKNCDATLGDTRCQIDLSQPHFSESMTIIARVSNHSVMTSTLTNLSAKHLAHGRLKFTSAPFASLAKTILSAREVEGGTELTLLEPLPIGDITGQAIELQVGCDKTVKTCTERFSNILNFQGFPHIPGNDFVLQVPGRGEGHDGGKRS